MSAALWSLCLLLAVGVSSALDCYTCSSKRGISGVTIAANIHSLIQNFPPCEEFDPYNPQQKFIQRCPLLNDKGCMKVVDPTDSSNILRTCFLLAKNECMDGVCYCTDSLCNGAGTLAASALGLILATALIALH